VQTSARSSPRAIAPSTLRRASFESEPWWIPIGKVSSFTSHRFWKMYSARKRVLVKTSVVRLARICS
jgi:hypothetical protein